jgi:hypothetical protein
MYVGLHELAHVMSITAHHTDEFWENFNYLISQATKYNMYTPIDYSQHPVPYCAMIVYDNPYFRERNTQDLLQELIKEIQNGG